VSDAALFVGGLGGSPPLALVAMFVRTLTLAGPVSGDQVGFLEPLSHLLLKIESGPT